MRRLGDPYACLMNFYMLIHSQHLLLHFLKNVQLCMRTLCVNPNVKFSLIIKFLHLSFER